MQVSPGGSSTSGSSGSESFWRKFWENFGGVAVNTNPGDSATGGKVNGASTDHPTIPGTNAGTIFSSVPSGVTNWLSILMNPVILICIVVGVLYFKQK